MKTLAPSLITQTTAIAGGYEITGPILEKGIVWSTTPIDICSPFLLPTKVTFTTTNTVNFVATITGLIANTKYYVRAYQFYTTPVVCATPPPPALPRMNMIEYGPEFSFVTKAVTEGEDPATCPTKTITINPKQVYNVPPEYEVVGIDATALQADKLKASCSRIDELIDILRS